MISAKSENGTGCIDLRWLHIVLWCARHVHENGMNACLFALTMSRK